MTSSCSCRPSSEEEEDEEEEPDGKEEEEEEEEGEGGEEEWGDGFRSSQATAAPASAPAPAPQQQQQPAPADDFDEDNEWGESVFASSSSSSSALPLLCTPALFDALAAEARDRGAHLPGETVAALAAAFSSLPASHLSPSAAASLGSLVTARLDDKTPALRLPAAQLFHARALLKRLPPDATHASPSLPHRLTMDVAALWHQGHVVPWIVALLAVISVVVVLNSAPTGTSSSPAPAPVPGSLTQRAQRKMEEAQAQAQAASAANANAGAGADGKKQE